MAPRPGYSTRVVSFTAGGLAVAALLAVLACGSRPPLVVGGLVSETGAASVYGKEIREGMDLALEEVNQAGLANGRKLSISYRDDGSSPDKARAALKDLIEKERVNAVIGGVTSAVVNGVLPVIRDREMVMLSPSASSAELTALGGGWFFRNYPSDMTEVQAMGQIVQDLDVKTLAILAFNETFGQSIAANLANQVSGGPVKLVLKADFGTPLLPSDALALAKQVVASGAESVYLAGYVNEVAALCQALQTAGFKGVKISTSAVTTDIARLAGASAERLVFPQSVIDLEGTEPEVKAFVERFQAKYKRAPSVFAAYGYDAVKVFADALGRTKLGSGGELREQLVKTDHRGVTGEIRFDNRGDVKREPHLYLVRRGETMHFERVDPSIRGILLP